MKCGLLQINVRVGDVEANGAALVAAVRRAAEQGAQICVTPAMALTGYPPRALLGSAGFLTAVEQAERRLAVDLIAMAPDAPPLILGSVGRGADGRVQHQAVLLAGGVVGARVSAHCLPACDGFDEAQWCAPGSGPEVLAVGDVRVLVCVGADVERAMAAMCAAQTDKSSAMGIVHLAASPFFVGCQPRREDVLAHVARQCALPVVSVNHVGGNDRVVFDGRSVLLTAEGVVAARCARCAQDVRVVDLAATGPVTPEVDTTPEAEMWDALVLGTRDYAQKTGMHRAVLGLSGGVDSALVAAIACEALGPEQVTGLLMPSPWSSEHSLTDAHDLARMLGMTTHTVPIAPAMDAFAELLAPVFAGRGADLTEENIQARIRGTLLMAYANKFGALLLSTGNKSEVLVGYCTLYGDTCGGLAVIADVFKTEVYRLCDWLNRTRGPHIPHHTLTKAPSAELRPEQTDQDSLPPYDQLDAILDGLVVRRLPQAEVCAAGSAPSYAPAVVDRVARLVAGSEFKRHQLAPGLSLSAHALEAARLPVACYQAVLR